MTRNLNNHCWSLWSGFSSDLCLWIKWQTYQVKAERQTRILQLLMVQGKHKDSHTSVTRKYFYIFICKLMWYYSAQRVWHKKLFFVHPLKVRLPRVLSTMTKTEILVRTRKYSVLTRSFKCYAVIFNDMFFSKNISCLTVNHEILLRLIFHIIIWYWKHILFKLFI